MPPKKATQSKENSSTFAEGPIINEILDLLRQQQQQRLQLIQQVALVMEGDQRLTVNDKSDKNMGVGRKGGVMYHNYGRVAILQRVVEWLFKILHPKGQHPAQLEIELSKEPRNQAFRGANGLSSKFVMCGIIDPNPRSLRVSP
ncbi:hypothetical protein AgCh_034270 [Apium graveolens]